MNIFITINSIDCDILALQEINHLNEGAIEKIHTKSVMMKKERNHERGGGTMTLSELNITRGLGKVLSRKSRKKAEFSHLSRKKQNYKKKI